MPKREEKKMNDVRVQRLVRKAISRFSLDLRGFSVLTEAATGTYVLTSLIAALAGARPVFAMTKDSRFGSVKEVYAQTMDLAKKWEVEDCLNILTDRHDENIGKADIITNLGFVRPFTSKFLARLKEGCVIPLMWEPWEYRSEDLDLEECRRLGIPVLGTNEHHSLLKTFDYIGHIAIKMLMEADVEVFQSKVVVLGRGEFAQKTVSTLTSCGAMVRFISTEKEKKGFDGDMDKPDALVVVDHETKEPIIGKDGSLSIDAVASMNQGMTVIHICGGIDQEALRERGIVVVPDNIAPIGYMSVGTDYVGPKPLIDLHVAGLKVGEEMARARRKGFSGFEAEIECLKKVPFAMGFSDRHKRH